jgi:segregation and condensation protein A
MDDYTVRLPDFHGPLDLLLHLVKRNEVDVRDIPVAQIADQFRQYLDVLQVIDVEAAGDFLVLAAMLLEIKSRMVLRRPEEEKPEAEPADDDPRRELVRQLLEYKRYRDAAAQLESHALEQQRQLPRGDIEEPQAVAARGVQTPELWDLVSAFGRIMQEAAALAPEQIVADDTPQQAYVEQVLELVRLRRSVPFREVFTPPYHRLRLIGLFLAILELIKNQQLLAVGDETTGAITLEATPVKSTCQRSDERS